MKKIYKFYEMDCFLLDMCRFKPVYAHLDIEYVKITEENCKLIKKIRGDYKNEKKRLNGGDTGILALYNNEVVGYGWYKDRDSKFSDDFYKINKKGNVCYLGRFFVRKDLRGNNIYPGIITNLIQYHESKYPGGKYYISAYADNVSSIKGLSKVGFSLVGRYSFMRILKQTINKKTLL